MYFGGYGIGRIRLNTEIKNAILASDEETQYDESAKRLFGQKIILAHIWIERVHIYQIMKFLRHFSLRRNNK